jgi:hypothetical protein
MKTMINENGSEINIIQHIITKNFWEFYVTDDKFNDDIVRCLVVGDEVELGDVSLSEIAPYIISKTKRLGDVMPAPQWAWKE